MTDRELLEMAARAAGIIHHGWHEVPKYEPYCDMNQNDYEGLDTECGAWNPLTDDGDALRLAVKLHIDLCINNGVSEAVWINESVSATHSIEVPCDEYFEGWDAKFAATRRAIVRAAAEIGKEMK